MTGAETELFFAITWERVRSASDIDKTIQMLINLIFKGFPESKKDLLRYANTGRHETSLMFLMGKSYTMKGL